MFALLRKKPLKCLSIGLFSGLLIAGAQASPAPKTEPLSSSAKLYHYLNAEGSENPASAYKMALSLLSEGDTASGEAWLKRSADQGHPDACLAMARRTEGADAQRYLAVALKHGLPEAKRYLSTLYEDGIKGYPTNFRQAFVLQYELAQQGDAEAMHVVAFYFVRGLHGVKNDVAAAHWYHQAARAGHKAGAEAFAWMLENGVGTQKNVEDAAWYRSLAGNASSRLK